MTRHLRSHRRQAQTLGSQIAWPLVVNAELFAIVSPAPIGYPSLASRSDRRCVPAILPRSTRPRAQALPKRHELLRLLVPSQPNPPEPGRPSPRQLVRVFEHRWSQRRRRVCECGRAHVSQNSPLVRANAPHDGHGPSSTTTTDAQSKIWAASRPGAGARPGSVRWLPEPQCHVRSTEPEHPFTGIDIPTGSQTKPRRSILTSLT